MPNPKYAGAVDFNWQPESDGRMSIPLQPAGAERPPLEAEADDDFERFEQDAAFNPARFRTTGENEVQVEGMIGNSAEHASSDPLPIWVFPAGYRPASRCDFDVACDAGFTVVTVNPDGTFLADPTAEWVDLHGVRFRIK